MLRVGHSDQVADILGLSSMIDGNCETISCLRRPLFSTTTRLSIYWIAKFSSIGKKELFNCRSVLVCVDRLLEVDTRCLVGWVGDVSNVFDDL